MQSFGDYVRGMSQPGRVSEALEEEEDNSENAPIKSRVSRNDFLRKKSTFGRALTR